MLRGIERWLMSGRNRFGDMIVSLGNRNRVSVCETNTFFARSTIEQYLPSK